MTPQQIAILNALVTYAAEHVPGGLSADEREVAQLVGRWALSPEKLLDQPRAILGYKIDDKIYSPDDVTLIIKGGDVIKTHDYKVINTSLYGNTEEVANLWAERGWRVVAAMGSQGRGYADQLVIERPVGVAHPDD